MQRYIYNGGMLGMCFILVLGAIQISQAQVMESNNYRIQSDSINVGGGRSSSSNYTLESTAGEIATGLSESDSYVMKAGYQQMQEVYIALTGAESIVLYPPIPEGEEGESDGKTTVLVTTDSPSGYQLTIESEDGPAMQSASSSLSDYPAGGSPHYTFSTGPNEAHFGFTPEGVDITDRFLDDGSQCGTGGQDTELACWDGLTTNPASIAKNINSNHPDGATTTIRFRVGVGTRADPETGVYSADIVITALSL